MNNVKDLGHKDRFGTPIKLGDKVVYFYANRSSGVYFIHSKVVDFTTERVTLSRGMRIKPCNCFIANDDPRWETDR